MDKIKIQIEKIPEEAGGGYCAYVLPYPLYLRGDGHNVTAAVESLLQFIKILIKEGTLTNDWQFK